MLTFLVLAASVGAALPAAVSAEADTPEHAIRNFYQALATDDQQGFARLTSEEFYAFDVGKRFAGKELSDVIRTMHASGKILEWNLSGIDVHISGNFAWAAWENHGAVDTAGTMRPMSWLESAVLHRSGGKWKLVFLHSNRAEA